MHSDLRKLVESLSTQTTGSRNSALSPLLWMLTILCSFVVALAQCKAAFWLMTLGASAIVAVILVALVWYCVFAKRDRDALRSEKYVLSRRAMDLGLLGDDRSGLHDPSKEVLSSGSEVPLLLDPTGPKKVADEK